MNYKNIVMALMLMCAGSFAAEANRSAHVTVKITNDTQKQIYAAVYYFYPGDYSRGFASRAVEIKEPACIDVGETWSWRSFDALKGNLFMAVVAEDESDLGKIIKTFPARKRSVKWTISKDGTMYATAYYAKGTLRLGGWKKR